MNNIESVLADFLENLRAVLDKGIGQVVSALRIKAAASVSVSPNALLERRVEALSKELKKYEDKEMSRRKFLPPSNFIDATKKDLDGKIRIEILNNQGFEVWYYPHGASLPKAAYLLLDASVVLKDISIDICPAYGRKVRAFYDPDQNRVKIMKESNL